MTWNPETKEISESNGMAEVVIGYAVNQTDANEQIAKFRERE